LEASPPFLSVGQGCMLPSSRRAVERGGRGGRCRREATGSPLSFNSALGKLHRKEQGIAVALVVRTPD